MECDWCSDGQMVMRNGPHGRFLGCNQFPRCRRSKSITDDVDGEMKRVVEWYDERDPEFFEVDEYAFDEEGEIARGERAYEKWLDR